MKLKNDEMTKFLYYAFKLKILFPPMKLRNIILIFQPMEKTIIFKKIIN